ncbi:MAG: MFS transporter, partial [Candidatus Portnoybacteria bacterium CG_4_9_14_3_um_filter_44_9]
SSALGIGAGVGGVIGGMIAKSFGFNLLFVAMGALGILSAILCFFIKEELLSKNSFQGE